MNFFFELLSAFNAAIKCPDNVTIAATLEFSRWCLFQDEKELWNSAAVGFYEHVFDDAISRSEVAKWIDRGVAREIAPLWEFRLGEQVSKECIELIAENKEKPPVQMRSAGALDGLVGD